MNLIVTDVSHETAAGKFPPLFYNAQIALTEQRLGIAGKAGAVVKSIASTPPACSVFVSDPPPFVLYISAAVHLFIYILLSFILN